MKGETQLKGGPDPVFFAGLPKRVMTLAAGAHSSRWRRGGMFPSSLNRLIRSALWRTSIYRFPHTQSNDILLGCRLWP